jgi:hypothetical protein
MIAASPDSNGEEEPKSKVKPVFLDELCQIIFVPAFTQKGAFALAPGILGMTDAPFPVRLTSIEHGVEEDPHVLLALQIDCGSGSVQVCLSAPAT